MKYSNIEIYKIITDWIAANFQGDYLGNWYVGIASDIQKRLFEDHSVADCFIYEKAINTAHARSAEQMLLNSGFDGGTGGGDCTTTYVYAFKKLPGTRR